MDHDSTCIMVLGIPRSGTSAVAGALHHAGVKMMRNSWKDDLNPKGYYEDRRWKAAMQGIAGQTRDYVLKPPDGIPDTMIDLFESMIADYGQEKLWGIKYPRLATVAPYIWHLFDDLRIVAVRREFEASVRSMWSHSHVAYSGSREKSEDHIRGLMGDWRVVLEDALAAWEGPQTKVWYEDLIADPLDEVGRLCWFAARLTGEELDPSAGAAFVDPDLDHDGRHPQAEHLFEKQI